MAQQGDALSHEELADWIASFPDGEIELLESSRFPDEPRGDPSQPTNYQLYSTSINNDVIMNDSQNLDGVRSEPVVQVLEQSNIELVGAGRTQVEEEEEDILNNSGRVAQPGAGAGSSGGLRHNPSETRGAPLLNGSTKLVGRAFAKNRNVIWSWLTDDEVSTIGIYWMGGAGKTEEVRPVGQTGTLSTEVFMNYSARQRRYGQWGRQEPYPQRCS